MRKPKKYEIYCDCDLRNHIQELSINIPENAKYIAIESSKVPLGKFLFFYNEREYFLENRILDDKKYKKLEEFLEEHGS
jgi:hypothetical protein